MLAQFLDRQDSVSEVSVTANEDGRIIVVSEGMYQHVRSEADVDSLLVRRNIGPSVVYETAQAQLNVLQPLDILKEALLVYVFGCLLGLVFGCIVVLGSDQPALRSQLVTELLKV